MGNVLTHGWISAETIRRLEALLPGQPYEYLSLGNFLADASGFNDPVAFIQAKAAMKEQSGTWTPFLRLVGFRAYADDLMGTPSRQAALSLYFRRLAYTVCVAFRDALHLAPTDLDAVFEQNFTQYYPHEHMDFPPAPRPSDYRQGLYRYNGRHVLRYVDEYVECLAQELTAIERDWKRALATGASTRLDGMLILARLGRTLHAVEDYFFHSNFAEALWLREALKDHRHRAIARPTPRTSALPAQRGRGADYPQEWNDHDLAFDPSFSEWFDQHALDQRREGNWLRYRRIYYRRLRYMRYSERGPALIPDRETSLDASGFIHTGGFGSADVYHTLGEGLESIERLFSATIDVKGVHVRLSVRPPWKGSGLVLFASLFSEQVRHEMYQNPNLLRGVVVSHRNQLTGNLYAQEIRALEAHSIISKAVADQLVLLFDLDRQVTLDHSDELPGLGGFLAHLASNSQRQLDHSRLGARSLDGTNIVRDVRTDNEVSGEQISTHSLLNKDADGNGPFRPDAIGLAAYASRTIALLMASEVATRDQSRAIRWGGLLRQFIRFPRSGAQDWEHRVALSARNLEDQSAAYTIPIDLAGSWPIEHASVQDPVVVQALSGRKRFDLEQRYNALLALAEQRWARMW